MFIIEDWAGNHKFRDCRFPTFQDAWNFLYEAFPEEADEGNLEEFWVVKEE